MRLRIRINKEKDDSYTIQSNHIPRFKEFIEIDNHRFVVEYISYIVDEVLQNEFTDVIIYVKQIY